MTACASFSRACTYTSTALQHAAVHLSCVQRLGVIAIPQPVFPGRILHATRPATENSCRMQLRHWLLDQAHSPACFNNSTRLQLFVVLVNSELHVLLLSLQAKATGQLAPTKKGVSLSSSEWAAVEAVLPQLSLCSGTY
jgi:hypothetical protein